MKKEILRNSITIGELFRQPKLPEDYPLDTDKLMLEFEELKESYQLKFPQARPIDFLNEYDIIMNERIGFLKENKKYTDYYELLLKYQEHYDFIKALIEKEDKNRLFKEVRFPELTSVEIAVLLKQLRDAFKISLTDAELSKIMTLFLRDKDGNMVQRPQTILSKIRTKDISNHTAVYKAAKRNKNIFCKSEMVYEDDEFKPSDKK